MKILIVVFYLSIIENYKIDVYAYIIITVMVIAYIPGFFMFLKKGSK